MPSNIELDYTSRITQTRGSARIIERLDKLSAAGENKWISRCPAHNDRNPSLSIRELDDGRVLIHCFAGCSATDVMSSIGLTLSDLYPINPLSQSHMGTWQRQKLTEAYDFERSLITIYLSQQKEGKAAGLSDIQRVKLAYRRISKIRRVLNEQFTH